MSCGTFQGSMIKFAIYKVSSVINEANSDKEWIMGGNWNEDNGQDFFFLKITKNNFKYCDVKSTRMQRYKTYEQRVAIIVF